MPVTALPRRRRRRRRPGRPVVRDLPRRRGPARRSLDPDRLRRAAPPARGRGDQLRRRAVQPRRSICCSSAVPVIVALVRRRPRHAAVMLAIVLGANLTTQILKPLLAAPRPLNDVVDGTYLFVNAASWPSGHATAAMSLCLCAVLAAPSRWRPHVGALMAVFAIAVCYSFLELAWHFPSDVLGGFLVASVWGLGGAAAPVLGRGPLAVGSRRGWGGARAGLGGRGAASGRRGRGRRRGGRGRDRRWPGRTRWSATPVATPPSCSGRRRSR